MLCLFINRQERTNMKVQFLCKQTAEYILTVDVPGELQEAVNNNDNALMAIWRITHTDDADMNDFVSNIDEEIFTYPEEEAKLKTG